MIVQVDHQGHPHQQLNSRQLQRHHLAPESRPSCNNSALLTPQESIVKNAVNQQHQKNDVWTFPEGSSVLAQNGGSLLSTVQINRNVPTQAEMPDNLVSQSNKGTNNAMFISILPLKQNQHDFNYHSVQIS